MRIAIAAALGLLVVMLSAAPASAADCPGEAPREQPFLEWGDDGSYFLAPGGDFDSSASGWTLQRGASVVADASPDGWGASLSLPAGGSATSPPICVAPGYTHGRMFGQATGALRGLGSLIRVDVLEADTNARVGRLPSLLGVDRRWDATRRFGLDEDDFDLDPQTGLGAVRVKLTTLGPATSLIDGVYIDPRARN